MERCPCRSVLQVSGERQSFRIYVDYIKDVGNSFMCKHINNLSIPQGREGSFCAKLCVAFCGLLPSVMSVQCEETKTNWLPRTNPILPHQKKSL